MPLNKVQWDPINHRGNPTKADVVNKTIERVVQFELKGKGAHAQDARALEFAEFQNVIQQSRTKVMLGEQEIYKYVHTAFRLIQYHLCARTDDIVLLDTDEIRRNKFGSIDIKLCASKNMYRKEDSYWQILFANMSPSLCPLLALGIYVSLFADGDLCKHENRIVKKSEKHKEPKLPGFFRLGRDKCYGKASLNYRFRMCVEKLGFEGRLSPHSIRKLSATEMQIK